MDRWHVAWAERERLLRLARARTPTREDAEDVVAEAIRRAGVAEDVPLDALPAWLTRVTVNLCVDRHRRRATQQALVQRAELRCEDTPSHEDAVVDRLEAAWVAGRLDDLPARQAAALRLRAEGRDVPSIAATLGLTVNAVDGLLKRGRAVLREALRASAVLLGWRWVRSPRGGGVVAAALAIAVLVLPHSSTPHSPRRAAPPSSGPAVAGPLIGAAATEQRGPTLTDHLAGGALVGGRRGVRPTSWDGPSCLLPVCVELVDGSTERALGADSPQGWTPSDLHAYFGEPDWVPAVDERAPVVAVVGTGRFDWVVDDLADYRDAFGLPSCTKDNGCLTVADPESVEPEWERPTDAVEVVQGQGSARLAGVTYNASYGVQQSQMLQGVSASCPECRLLLVRSPSAYDQDLAAALALASRRAQVVVTDLAITELAEDLFAARDLLGPSLVLVAGGVGGPTESVNLPAGRDDVVVVGGTSVADGHAVATDEAEVFCRPGVIPRWQQHLATGCLGRAGVDMAAPGGKGMELATYVSGGVRVRGWYHPGHTFQAAAIAAGQLARHGAYTAVHGPGDLYAHPEWFSDVVHGGTTTLTDPTQKTCERLRCAAGPGWDGASGWGELHHLPWW